MSLVLVLIGILTGLSAGLAVCCNGAGLGMAFLTYMGCGSLGMGLALALGLALAGQGAEDQGSWR